MAVFGVATAGALARVKITSRVFLRVATDAELALARPEFGIDGGGLVFRPPALALRTALGAEAHF